MSYDDNTPAITAGAMRSLAEEARRLTDQARMKQARMKAFETFVGPRIKAAAMEGQTRIDDMGLIRSVDKQTQLRIFLEVLLDIRGLLAQSVKVSPTSETT